MTPRCLLPPQGRPADAVTRTSSQIPRLETERLILRAPILADFAVWKGFFVGENASDESEVEKAWLEFCNYTAGWVLHGHGLLAVERKETSVTLGFALLGLEWEDTEPELGWMLAPEARDQGYSSEAVRALRDYGLHLLGPGNFVSYIDDKNQRSIAVAQNLGATPDGTALGAPNTLVFRHGARQ